MTNTEVLKQIQLQTVHKTPTEKVIRLEADKWVWAADYLPALPTDLTGNNAFEAFLDGLGPERIITSHLLPPRVLPTQIPVALTSGLSGVAASKWHFKFKGEALRARDQYRDIGIPPLEKLLDILSVCRPDDFRWYETYWYWFLKPILKWCQNPHQTLPSYIIDFFETFVETRSNFINAQSSTFTKMKLFFFTGMLKQFGQNELINFLWNGSETLGDIQAAAFEQQLRNRVEENSPYFEEIFGISSGIKESKPLVVFKDDFKKIWTSQEDREYVVAKRINIITDLLREVYSIRGQQDAVLTWEKLGHKSYDSIRDAMNRLKTDKSTQTFLAEIVIGLRSSSKFRLNPAYEYSDD